MKRYILILTALLLIPVITPGRVSARSVDELMGLSIQKYLEGNMTETIDLLDEVLDKEPGNTRARDLMERSAARLAEISRTESQARSALGYLRKASERLPDSERIRESLERISEVAGVREPEPAPAAPAEPTPAPSPVPAPSAPPPPTAPAPAAPAADQEVHERYQQRINALTGRIRGLENRISESDGTKRELIAEVREMKEERALMIERLEELRELYPGQRGTPLWIILIAVVAVSAGGTVFMYRIYVGGNSLLQRSLAREKQAIDELRDSYNKDTEALAQKLSEYGKVTQRAGKLESNWDKAFEILERLSRGGSTRKLVISDPTGKRKAVTGVDPRSRARADSVEVIADIFKDTTKAAEMLKPFLGDPDNRTRANAAVAYHRYDPEKAVAVLHEMASDKDKWMRLSAAWALGQIGDSDTTKVLERLLDDPDTEVKNKARLSLEKIISSERST